MALSGGSQGGESTSAFGRAAEVHGRTASAAFDANDPKEILDVQCNQLSGCRTGQHTPVVKSIILRSYPVWR